MHSYSVLTGLSDFTEPAGSVQVYCAKLIAQLLPLMAPSWSNGALPFLWRRVSLAYLAYPDHHATGCMRCILIDAHLSDGDQLVMLDVLEIDLFKVITCVCVSTLSDNVCIAFL